MSSYKNYKWFRKRNLLLGAIFIFFLIIFVLRFARKSQEGSIYQGFSDKETLVQRSIDLIKDTLRKNQVLVNQLEKSNLNYESLLRQSNSKDSLNLIKERIIDDILRKADFPVPPSEDDLPPFPPRPKDPIPNPDPEDEHLEYLGSVEREKFFENYKLFSNKPHFFSFFNHLLEKMEINGGMSSSILQYLYKDLREKYGSGLDEIFFISSGIDKVKNFIVEADKHKLSFINVTTRLHSSLLTYERETKNWRHYDSYGTNVSAVRALNLPGHYQEMPTPHQKNGYSCVLWTFFINKLLVERYMNKSGTMSWEIMSEESDLRDSIDNSKKILRNLLEKEVVRFQKGVQEKINNSSNPLLETTIEKAKEILCVSNAIEDWLQETSGKSLADVADVYDEARYWLLGGFTEEVRRKIEEFPQIKKVERLSSKNLFYSFFKNYLT